MKKKWIIITAVIGMILIGGIGWLMLINNIEIPKYEVIRSEKNIEIRRYEHMIIARVEVEGPRQEAIRDGFRLLADYIFGNNTVKQSMAMTAPVQQQKSIQIKMTAPVSQQSHGDVWQISFVMPSSYKIETLPHPNNARVLLTEISPKQFAVIRFSGRSTDETVKAHEKQLMAYTKAKNIEVIGLPTYAFYNPPWTLPFMRRNEVMVEIHPE